MDGSEGLPRRLAKPSAPSAPSTGSCTATIVSWILSPVMAVLAGCHPTPPFELLCSRSVFFNEVIFISRQVHHEHVTVHGFRP